MHPMMAISGYKFARYISLQDISLQENSAGKQLTLEGGDMTFRRALALFILLLNWCS